MKKLTFLFAFILLLNGCSKDDNSSNQQEINELKTLSVNIELPTGASISANDLTVSSLFNENMPINNNDTEIESFNESSMELTFATNSQDNMVMLCYFNPIDSDIIEMNTESTAVALIMLHPWTFDLSVNAKAEAITYIKNLPEFESYKNTVENSISSGELNPLNTQVVLEKVTEIQQITFNRTNEYIEPLLFNVENSTATIKNVQSSASYSIGLYDESDQLRGSTKLASGLAKSHYLFQEFQNSSFQSTESSSQTVSFDIPSDGNWTLKAKSGLSFDGSTENLEAAIDNTGSLALNVLGLFSTKLKKLLKKQENLECVYNVGDFIWNGTSGTVNISQIFQNYSNGTISGYQLTRSISSFLYDRVDGMVDIIGSCVNNPEYYGLNALKKPFFKNILRFVNVLGNLQNAFDGSAMLTDWIQYDKDIEYCFTKNGNEISECVPIFDYEGDWYLKTFLEDDGSGTGSGNFNLYWEHLFEFDSNGFAPNVLSKNLNATEYTISDVSYNLTFNPTNSILTLTNNYAGVSNNFIVDSVEDIIFYSTGGYPETKFELYRQ